MIKKLFIYLGCYLLLIGTARSETIKGRAMVRDQANGKIMFNLNHGTIVASTEVIDGWCWIRVLVHIDEAGVLDGSYLIKDAILKSPLGEPIGQLRQDLKPPLFFEHQDSCYAVELSGYIPSYQIEPTSIVEWALDTIIEKHREEPLLDYFKSHLAQFAYQPWGGVGGFNSYIYRETPKAYENPGPRVLLIFAEKRLVALIHSRQLTLPDYEVSTANERYRIAFVEGLNPLAKQIISDYYFDKINQLH